MLRRLHLASYTKRGRRWLCRVYSRDLGKTIGRTGRTKRLAFEAAEARRRELEGGLLPEYDTLTVADYLQDWLDRRRGFVSDRTLDWYRYLAETHVAPTLGRHTLARLRPMDVQDLYRHLAADGRRDGKAGGLSPSTVRSVHKVLHKALADAVRLEVVRRNVADAVSLPSVERRRIESISVDSMQRILSAVKGTLVDQETHFTCYTGVRVGELVALRWADVDLDAGAARIRRAMTRVLNRGLVVTPPKSYAGHRLVPLPPSLVAMLRAHRATQAEHRLNIGIVWEDLDLVFPSSIGTPQDPRNVLRRFQGALADAGLPRMRWHDLRHGCASLMLSDGVPLSTVSELIGHSGIQTTKDVYGHITEDAKHAAGRRIEALLAR